MARQLFSLLAATILLFLSISPLTLAADSPAATAYIQKTCNDATYDTLCLDTLLPNAADINGNPKSATRVAIQATIAKVQSVSSSFVNLSEHPEEWTNEVKSLHRCGTTIAASVTHLLDAYELMTHLGGGGKAVKVLKRQSMANSVTSVLNALNTCVGHLETSSATGKEIRRAQEAMEPLAELATNAVDLIKHMPF
ncbi:pectinesterase inhibitor 11-like [Spinacia oleracea]|uniref:Pectinesterase inhibitor 11-like n=1 Tax=Spinacia oleracea TaxID=3562 RepID=A0A9R0I2F0_SPIOL|nr:pectinesterase inhibitor 11-like [Spinacia oleracea]